MTAQRGFLGPDERYAALSKAGDPPERLEGIIDFELDTRKDLVLNVELCFTGCMDVRS